MTTVWSFIRVWLAPVVCGFLSLHLLISLWGYLLAQLWLPIMQWAWADHRVKLDGFLFDVFVGLLIGMLTALLAIRIRVGSVVRTLNLFLFGVLLAFAVPPPEDPKRLYMVVGIPVVFSFLISSTSVGLWHVLRSSRQNVV